MTNEVTAPGRWWSSIRVRIVVGYVVLLAVALAISILLTHQVLAGRLEREIDQALTQEVEELRNLAGGTDPQTGEPFGNDVEAIFDTFLRRNVPATNESFFTLVDDEVFLVSFDAPPTVWTDRELIGAWASVTEPTRAAAPSDEGEVRYLAVPLGNDGETAGVFVVAHFADDDRDEVLVVVRVLTAAGIVVLAASALLAWSLSGRVLRPVRDLTATAHRITETDLSQRLEVTGHDELTELGSTFNAMVDRLEESFEQQRQFLDDVAHELRTPITIVQGNVDLLPDDPAERAASVETINDELSRMNRYVDDLLLLAKAERGDFLRIEPVDVGELATTVIDRVRPLGTRDWQLAAAPPGGSVALLADRARIVQALLNLATNACQHTDDDDMIEIGFESTGGTVKMWVRDTGPGIDPDVIDQLFERRFRGAASRARRAEGMGIGLSIVDAIARGHGGHAEAANDPAGGARFTIELPLEPTPEELS